MINWGYPMFDGANKREAAEINNVFQEIVTAGNVSNLNNYADMMYADQIATLNERKKLLTKARRLNVFAGGSILTGIVLFGALQNMPDTMPGVKIVAAMSSAALVLSGIGLNNSADYLKNNLPDIEMIDDEPTE